MENSAFVTVDGKSYEVRPRWNGQFDIFARWESFNVSERNLICRSTITRTKRIDPNGRIGKKVLAVYSEPLRARLCTPMTVGQASIAASTVR